MTKKQFDRQHTLANNIDLVEGKMQDIDRVLADTDTLSISVFAHDSSGQGKSLAYHVNNDEIVRAMLSAEKQRLSDLLDKWQLEFETLV